MSFITAHGLSWSALDDLLGIINLLFGPDTLPRTKHMFRKLWACKLKGALNYYYCDFCQCLLEEETGTPDKLPCSTCHMSLTHSEFKNDGHFFTILDLPCQLMQVISKTSDNLYANLERVNQDVQCETDITDITTGSL